jgi:hypothetical protein
VLDYYVDPLDVVERGSQSQHGVGKSVAYLNTVNGAGIEVDSIDAPVFSPWTAVNATYTSTSAGISIGADHTGRHAHSMRKTGRGRLGVLLQVAEVGRQREYQYRRCTGTGTYRWKRAGLASRLLSLGTKPTATLLDVFVCLHDSLASCR